MAVAASSIINRVRTQLIDEGSTKRWSDTELLRWLSDGERTIVAANPTASALTATRALVSGAKQTGPTDCYKVLTVYSNVSGRAISMVPRSLLDSQYPTWTNTGSAAEVRHFFLDPADEKCFYVYPINNGSGSVNLSYSKYPVELTSTSDNLTVDDIYQTALFDYVMFRAHSKDSDFAAGQALAAGYLQAFTAYIGSEAGSGG